MTNHTATVATLTAQVRVLMVGSRQVTMSVYGQLDYVEPACINPFGRVKPKDAAWWRIYVVGQDQGTCTLVRSSTLSEAALADLREGKRIRDRQYQVSVPEWDSATEKDRDRFAQVAEQWSALPLIILAGLR
jgi:hypothetical protein